MGGCQSVKQEGERARQRVQKEEGGREIDAGRREGEVQGAGDGREREGQDGRA